LKKSGGAVEALAREANADFKDSRFTTEAFLAA
jgi:hypothetical protein